MTWLFLAVSIVCEVVAIAARVIWREVLTRRMMLGIALIVVGVLLVEFA